MPKGIKGFQKGHTTSEETRKKISEKLKGKPKSKEHKIKLSIIKKGKPSLRKGRKFPDTQGEKHFAWKGEKAGLIPKHLWIKRYYGKANKCQNPCCKYANPKRYEWANISGKYLRDISDWMQLCPSCHRKIDGNCFQKGNQVARKQEK